MGSETVAIAKTANKATASGEHSYGLLEISYFKGGRLSSDRFRLISSKAAGHVLRNLTSWEVDVPTCLAVSATSNWWSQTKPRASAKIEA